MWRNIFWRNLAGFWAIITMLLFAIEFFYLKKSDTMANLASIIYVTILGIYAGTKEFYRWSQEDYSSAHWGEFFVFYWTAMMLATIVFALWQNVKLPEGLVATYIAIVSIYALTRRSKHLYYKRKIKKI